MSVSRSRSVKPLVRGLLSLAALAPFALGGGLWAAEPSPSKANTPDQNCKNKSTYCKPCCEGSGDYAKSPSTDDTTDCGSLIDNSAWSYYHYAWDYRVALPGEQNSGGCTPCGGSSSATLPGALPSFEIKRVHQYRWLGNRSSFGPGVFWGYDVSLELSTVGQWWTNSGKTSVRLINPSTTMFSINTYDHDWSQADFSSPQMTRTDATIDFDWATGSPGSGIPADGYAVRWTGTVIPTASETYAFHTTSDDGVRLWVNGQLLVDNWNDHGATENSGSIALVAGQPYSIRMEMYENGGDAVAKLAWSSPSTPKAVIPSTALRTPGNQPGLQGEYTTAFGATDGVYQDNDPYGQRSFRQLKDIRVYDTANALTRDQAAAKTAVLTTLDGEVLTFEVFRTDTNAATTERVARLTSWKDRNGNGLTFTYTYAVTTDPAAAGGDLQKLWWLNTVTDAYGRVATVQYKATQSAGRWVVESIGLPNGQTVTYRYDNSGVSGAGESTITGLSKVEHADGTQSTFGTSISVESQCQVVAYDDATAPATSRRKQVHLTLTSWTDPVTSVVSGQPFGRLRVLVNGAGEVAWLGRQWIQGDGTRSFLIYRGGNDLMRFDFGNEFSGRIGRTYHATAWDRTFAADPSTYTWEAKDTDNTYDTWYRMTKRTDALGRKQEYTIDPASGTVNATKWFDGTTSSATYNGFRQPLHEVDRLGRVTDHSYDANGNHLTKTVAVGTAVQATWGWNYNARGQVLNDYDADYSAATPDLHVTSYVYNAAGYLINVVHAADVAGGPRPIYAYAYDAAGRLTQSTDPEGRKAIYTHDTRNRVTRIDYDDGSHEAITYGTGVDANLVTVRRDRNGNLTTYAYDAHGRLTTTTAASGTAVAAVSIKTYLAGTSDRVVSSTALGETTIAGYDHRNRQVTVSATPRSGVALTVTTAYDSLQRVAWTQDAYGRKTHPVYDINNRVVRTVKETMPGAIAAGTNLASLARDSGVNAAYLITDTVFDAEGQPLASIDPRGVRSDFLYDAQGRMTGQTVASAAPAPLAALGYRTDFAYDAQGNQTRVTHPRTFAEGQNFVTATTFSGRNLPLSVTEAVGRPEQATRSRTYTPTGRTRTETDFRGATTTFAYSPCCDRLKTVTDPAGGVITYAYDGQGNTVSIIDANGNETQTTFDARHRVATVRQVQENETASFAYDDNGADALGLSGTYAGQLAGLGLAVGGDGSVIEATNALGQKTLQVRDGLGRIVRVIDGLGHARTTSHDVVVGGLVETAMSDALGHVTRSRADGDDRVRQSVDAENRTTLLGYDASGNRISARDANNVGLDCQFDAAGRDVRCTGTAGAVTTRTYDAHGHIVSSTDALGKVTTCAFDARDRRIALLDRVAGATNYTYDANGNLLTVTDAEGAVTSYLYDSRNLLTAETAPAGQATPAVGQDVRTYTYDLGRRLATRTDQAGLITTYGYDHADRLVSRTYPDALNDQFAYDDAGRLTVATSQRFGTVVTRAFDAAGRLASETQTVGGYAYPVGYAYDDANRTTAITHPNGKQTTRAFTDRDQLATTAHDGVLVATRSYDAGGRAVTTTLGNGLVETRSYNADNTLAAVSVPGATNFSYTYDANKRKTYEGHQFAADLQTFGYDDENRVTAWTRDGQEAQTWSLTKVGDWSSTTRNGVAQTRSHSAAHETIAIAGITSALAHDAKGNLTQDQHGRRFGWDAENRLVAAVAGAATSGYFYDALGRRLAKAANGVATTFVHDGAQVIAEYEAPIYLSQDIGGPALAGSFSDSTTGTVTVSASGNDIWNNADQFRYAYFTLTGNGSIIAKVTTQTNTNQWAKAGVMLRDSLSANAKHAFMCITPGNGAAFQRRLVAGGSSSNSHTGGGSAIVPYWVCLTRSGSTVSGYRSADGVTWTLVGSDTVSFTASTVYAGLAVTAHTNGAVSTATFTNVAATGQVAMAVAPALARSYVYGSYVDEALALITATARTYLHANHLHSVAALTDAAGAVVERYRYDAFGQRTILAPDGVTVRPVSVHGNQRGFTGLHHDQETGALYARNRSYHPTLGRWFSRDPWRRMLDRPQALDGHPNGMNAYAAYFIANGLDPSGLVIIHTEEIRDAAGRLCGVVTVDWTAPPARGKSGKIYLKFDDSGRDANCGCCAGSRFGWIQHKCWPDGAGGLYCKYDNGAMKEQTATPASGGESDPNRPNQPNENDRPADGHWRENPWYGGPGNPGGQATPNDGNPVDPPTWPRNPRPQEGLYDEPGVGNETFISQLVCENGGNVLFQWQWTATQQGARRQFPRPPGGGAPGGAPGGGAPGGGGNPGGPRR